jgi:hypothetical protein
MLGIKQLRMLLIEKAFISGRLCVSLRFLRRIGSYALLLPRHIRSKPFRIDIQSYSQTRHGLQMEGIVRYKCSVEPVRSGMRRVSKRGYNGRRDGCGRAAFVVI